MTSRDSARRRREEKRRRRSETTWVMLVTVTKATSTWREYASGQAFGLRTWKLTLGCRL